MQQQLRWGILGTGKIGKRFAEGVARSRSGTLVAVGSRSRVVAEQFGEAYGAPHRYAGYDSVFQDRDVDAVYIATPHPLHARWAIRAAEAGKHILCEKPLTMNGAEAEAVIAAARRHDVFLMEAFMYRCHPQTQKLVELIQSGAIGDVRVIQATFSYNIGPTRPTTFWITRLAAAASSTLAATRSRWPGLWRARRRGSRLPSQSP